MTAMLLVRDADRTYLVELAPGATLRVGRAHDVDVPLRAARVSRHHAEIAPRPEGGHRVRDLGSTNGTQVDGRPVAEPGQPGAVDLPARAEIAIGACRLTYRGPA